MKTQTITGTVKDASEALVGIRATSTALYVIVPSRMAMRHFSLIPANANFNGVPLVISNQVENIEIVYNDE